MKRMNLSIGILSLLTALSAGLAQAEGPAPLKVGDFLKYNEHAGGLAGQVGQISAIYENGTIILDVDGGSRQVDQSVVGAFFSRTQPCKDQNGHSICGGDDILYVPRMPGIAVGNQGQVKRIFDDGTVQVKLANGLVELTDFSTIGKSLGCDPQHHVCVGDEVAVPGGDGLIEGKVEQILSNGYTRVGVNFFSRLFVPASELVKKVSSTAVSENRDAPVRSPEMSGPDLVRVAAAADSGRASD